MIIHSTSLRGRKCIIYQLSIQLSIQLSMQLSIQLKFQQVNIPGMMMINSVCSKYQNNDLLTSKANPGNKYFKQKDINLHRNKMHLDEVDIINRQDKGSSNLDKNSKKRSKPLGDSRQLPNLEDKVRKIIRTNQPNQEDNSDTLKDQSLTQPIRKNTNINQILLSQPIRNKYAHLLPEYMKRDYSLQQKTLLKAQSKLDEHLQYLKLHRGKKKGDFFNKVRQSLIDSAHFFLTLSQIKQILFLCPNLYECERQLNDGDKYDILISRSGDEITQVRKDKLRRALNEYLNKFEPNPKNGEDKKITIVIPERKFQFQQQMEKNKSINDKSKSQKSQKIQKIQKIQEETINPFDILNPGGTTAFKEKLYRLIKQKQQRIQLLKAQPKTPEIIKFTKKEYVTILDIMHLAYISKNISSMFEATLIGIINKQSTLGDSIIILIVNKLIQIGVQEKYIKLIDHPKGRIIQVDKKKYSDFHQKIESIENQSNSLSI